MMRSSTGQHWLALDHVRALAALLVFTWHFLHGLDGHPVPEGSTNIIPFVVLDQGDMGVSLFMTLSGYLFAKILGDHAIDYPSFFWNRFIRLFPLLAIVLSGPIIALAVRQGSIPFWYIKSLLPGLVAPALPGGAWSLTVEAHFYILLPILMLLTRQWLFVPLVLWIVAVVIRLLLWRSGFDVQILAYWTLVGRIDQFLFGILFFRLRARTKGAHLPMLALGSVFLTTYWLFDKAGGYGGINDVDLRNVVWCFLPSLEAVTFGASIAYYDTTFRPSQSPTSRFIGKVGEFSYSIYLLHAFVVFSAAHFIDTHIMSLQNFYVACLWSTVCFLMMVPIGWLSYHTVEKPFLRFRRPYVRARTTTFDPVANDQMPSAAR